MLLTNQSILSAGLNSIVGNEERIADKLSTVVEKSEASAQSHLLRQCKVAIKKVQKSVCRMTGEITDPLLDEVASLLPLQNLMAVKYIEESLDNEEFATAMKTFLIKVKGVSQNVNPVIRTLFTDELMEDFNWGGTNGKQALAQLKLFDKILRDIYQQQGSIKFISDVRKAVEKSHHRMHQKKYLKNKSSNKENENKAKN